MSKNNVQTPAVTQPDVEVVKPAKKPNVVEIKPLHVIQPVEFFQTVKSTAVPYEDPVETPVVEAPVVEEVKPNKKLRKSQGIWSVIAVVVFAAVLAVFLGFIEPLKLDFSISIGNWFDNGQPTLKIYELLGGYALGSLALSVLIRFIAGCFKKPTCTGCEFVKFCWTTIVVTVVSFLALALLNVSPFDSILEGLLEAFKGDNSPCHQFGLIVFGVCAALVVLVVVITIAHKAKDKKRAK